MFSQVTEKVICLCLAGYSVAIVKIYLDVFFEKENSVYRVAVWSPFFAWQFMLMGHMTQLPPGVNLLTTMGTLGMVLWLGYHGERGKKWVLGLVYLVLWMALEAVIEYGAVYVNGRTETDWLLLSLLSKVMLHLLVIIIGRWIRHHGAGRSALKKSTWMALLPAGSAVLYYVFYKTGQAAGSDRVAGLLMAGGLLVIVIDLSVYPIYIRLMEEAREKKNSQYYINQMERYRKQSVLEEQAATEFRETRHNLKQKLIYLRDMLEDGEQNRLEAMLTELIGDVGRSGRLVCETGNRAVDVLVNCKAHEVRERGGRLNADVRIPVELGITDTELIVLLGNALDNASEALEYVEKEKREIWLEMRHDKGILYIRMKNRFDGTMLRDGTGSLKSRKTGRDHGIGYFSMEKIVKKYHGEIKVEAESDIFGLEILIFC